MQRIGVIGAGTMGHGIAQVCAAAGCSVLLTDNDPAKLAAAMQSVKDNLDKGVKRGKTTPEVRDLALANLRTGDLAAAADGTDLIIEAIPERLDWKTALLVDLEARAKESAIFATNTSSLSITALSQALRDPGRLIGTHFFNPVHLMALLEIVLGASTRPEVLEVIKAFGAKIGKEIIVVQDRPGFATSRLGVLLGMEAIRMVEQGVATPDDIDKAMVLGYHHPVGPLRLTDMVGLDVRMNIGEYLARELGSAAFEPPALLKRMVAEGKLGKKSGEGFYRW